VTGSAEVAELHYQRFKEQHVAGWGDSWTLSRAEIEEWLAHGMTRHE